MSRTVWLREVEAADLPIFFEHQLDQAATELAAVPPRPWESFLAHWTRILGDVTIQKRSILFEGQVAGNIVCFEHEGRREIGYWLGSSFWGQGIATRALAQFLEQVATRPLYACVAKHNQSSRRVLEKCGFALVGEEPEFSIIGDHIIEGYRLELL